MIFQDLDATLNPKMRIRDILKEAITVHNPLSDAEVERRMGELLENVNLKKNKLSNFPYELSGGEKRRVGIARIRPPSPGFAISARPPPGGMPFPPLNQLRSDGEEIETECDLVIDF